MFKDIDLSVKVDAKRYKDEIAPLEKELAHLQLELKKKRIPVIITFDGFSAAGKGTLIGKIVHSLDPRYFKVHTMGKITENETRRPFLWGYWTRLPASGEMAIFDKSWCRALIPGTSSKWNLESAEYYNDIAAFERQMYDSGTLVIKLFLYISHEQQHKRLKELKNNPATEWRVDENDLIQNKNYNEYAASFERMLANTNSGERKWHIIEAEDRCYAVIKAFRTISEAIKSELTRRKSEPPKHVLRFVSDKPSILSTIDLNTEVSDYRKKLQRYQSHISELGFKLYSKQRSVAIVYEGWDASGKGGNIKRLTAQIDPRGYEVVPIFAPSKDELDHHYMWRFYNKLPKDGHITIFDRSWYGRVLVERVEGYALPYEWQRAYQEINEMERHWTNHGVIVLKFWLHIDKEEQLRRFNARAENPLKQYKITEEDWRNRGKWSLYEEAADEMLLKTNTDYAPWEVVPGNNKKFARLHVLKHVISELEARL